MDKKAWILGKSYTDESIAGAGAIKGAPCQIDSFIPSEDGKYTTVVFKWESASGTSYTDSMIVYNGDPGRGISSVAVNNVGHLIVTFDDGVESDAGEIPAQSSGIKWHMV